MKRIAVIIALIGFAAFASSCSGGAKSCAAYAKSDTDNRPSYTEVQ